jgi:hypothetical protein
LNWRREFKPMNLLLLAVVGFLLVAIIQIWWPGGDVSSPSPSAKGPQVPKAPILRDQQPLSAFRIVAAKNLFSQDRKDSPVEAAKSQDNLEGHLLLGTMTIGNTKAAIIGGKSPGSPKGTPEVESVYLGEEWNGFKVLEILNDSVTFHGKEGQKTLKFPE